MHKRLQAAISRFLSPVERGRDAQNQTREMVERAGDGGTRLFEKARSSKNSCVYFEADVPESPESQAFLRVGSVRTLSI
jgi:hypothetical protein